MPRHLRILVADHPFHVIQRGVNRSICYADDGDRTLFLGLLRELSGVHGCSLHAYVMMDNHFHLLLTGREPESVPIMMKNLGQRYVQFFNRKHQRSGTLWEGRYRSSLVDSEGYLFTCQRYIELNPVRARMVRHPSQYVWSSYRANAGEKRDDLLTPHRLYLRLGENQLERTSAYRTLFGDLIPDEELQSIRECVNGGFALGRPSYLEDLRQRLNRKVTAGASGRPRKNRTGVETVV
jgi:putative transposase